MITLAAAVVDAMSDGLAALHDRSHAAICLAYAIDDAVSVLRTVHGTGEHGDAFEWQWAPRHYRQAQYWFANAFAASINPWVVGAS